MTRTVIIGLLLLFGYSGYRIVTGFRHLMIEDRPEILYFRYRPELEDYARRFEAGNVTFQEKYELYGVPPEMCEYGAKYCKKYDGGFMITFSSILDNPVPELIYSATGFEPMPKEIEKMGRGCREWIRLAPKWAACYH